MTENIENPVNDNHIVFIIDGKVVHRLITDDRFAAVLQSDPVIRDITSLENKNSITLGSDYNSETDSFTPYKPYPSWIWDETSLNWVPPVSFPSSNGEPKAWTWAEDLQNWTEVPLDAAPIEYVPNPE